MFSSDNNRVRQFGFEAVGSGGVDGGAVGVESSVSGRGAEVGFVVVDEVDGGPEV